MDSSMKRHITKAAAPPDGGYGWFIVLSTFLTFGLTFGVIKAFGVFYVEIHRYFATTATGSSWITSISVATIHFAAPVGAVLSARFGHRVVVIGGGLLSSVGMVAGAHARNLMELYFTVGFLTGLGYALTWTPTVTMLGWYFECRRPMANALASAGECIITFLLTPLFQFLVDEYSWRGAMLVLGGLQLNLCVCGALLRPLGPPQKVQSIEATAEEGCDPGLEVHPRSNSGSGEAVSNPSSTKREDGSQLKDRILQYVDYTLITNARFMVYSMFGIFAALGFFAPALFLVPYAQSQGVEEYQAAALVSISAVLDLTGRLLFGWVANLRLVETVQQLTVTVIVLGVVLLLCPLATTFAQLAAFSVVYGLAYGATVSIHITVLAEVVGVKRFGSALGFFMLIRSSGGLLGPPIAGFFIDKMSDYGTGFLMAGVALIVSALFLLLLHQMNRRGRGAQKGEDVPPDDEKGTDNLKNWDSPDQKEDERSRERQDKEQWETEGRETGATDR
ncbi:monocarboxylate transporter 2 [Chanos chanos]|uniref:Monocarboxylate transporter 2 n=1 Tax=Chanos chanos TaxID=29144 RepID=A0A6J2WMB9_CHACN|nr:monocarboxylate transporter 2-like [Chanos chanos]